MVLPSLACFANESNNNRTFACIFNIFQSISQKHAGNIIVYTFCKFIIPILTSIRRALKRKSTSN